MNSRSERSRPGLVCGRLLPMVSALVWMGLLGVVLAVLALRRALLPTPRMRPGAQMRRGGRRVRP